MKLGNNRTKSKTRFKVLLIVMCFINALLIIPANSSNFTVNVVTEVLPPLQFNNAQGLPSGAMVDIVQATLEHAKIKGNISIFPWARSYQMALTQPNTLIFSIMKNTARENKFNWLGKIYHGEVYLIKLKKRKGLTLNTVEDALPHKIGVVRLDISQEYLKNKGFTVNKNVLLSPSYDHLWEQLYSRQIDFILANEFMWRIGNSHPSLKGETIEIVLALKDFSPYYYLAASLKTSPEITKKLTESLEIIKKNGQYQAILSKWQLK